MSQFRRWARLIYYFDRQDRRESYTWHGRFYCPDTDRRNRMIDRLGAFVSFGKVGPNFHDAKSLAEPGSPP